MFVVKIWACGHLSPTNVTSMQGFNSKFSNYNPLKSDGMFFQQISNFFLRSSGKGTWSKFRNPHCNQKSQFFDGVLIMDLYRQFFDDFVKTCDVLCFVNFLVTFDNPDKEALESWKLAPL